MQITNSYSKILFIAVCLFGFLACTNENKQERVKVSGDNLNSEDFEFFDLSPYTIPAELLLPLEKIIDRTEKKIVVEHDLDGFDWKINLNPFFGFSIEDWGGSNAFSNKVKEIENKKGYDFLLLNDSIAYYVDMNQAGNPIYYGLAQYNLEGINYLFISSVGIKNKANADIMIYSLKSVKPKIHSIQ